VIGEKDFHMIVSQMLIAMKREIPESPIPYPLASNSSNKITITPAKVS
jgi:hypothetical protein